MRRSYCGNCGSAQLTSFLNLGSTPLANAFPKAIEEEETFYPLELAVCLDCWLVQLLEVVDETELFATEYTFYSSTSPALKLYHQEYAQEIVTRFGEQAERLVVEIGCNDGSLLNELKLGGYRMVGIDPAPGPTEAARAKGLDVLTLPFSSKVADDVRAENGAAGLVLANHVLAHVQDLHDTLKGVRTLLAPDGLFIAEVQYLGDLLTGNMFDHVYHEHRFFFSITSLQDALSANGLHLISAKRVEPQGGSLRVVARRSEYSPDTPLVAAEAWANELCTYLSFQGRINHLRENLLQLLREYDHYRIAGYGASAKSTTLLNFCGIRDLEYVVDTTPAKQGRFTPGTHIPIISPEQEQQLDYLDAYLLTTWNYLGSLLRKSDITMPGSTKWIVPIPMPVIL